MPECKKTANFECKKINRLTLIFGYNSQISVEEFIFITRLIQVQI